METKDQITAKIEELQKAKDNAKTCLEDAQVSVDFHGLAYWAERVEKLRKEIKEAL